MSDCSILKVKQTGFSKIIDDYVNESSRLSSFVIDFPSIESFGKQFSKVQFDASKRTVLHKALVNQYAKSNIEPPEMLADLINSNTFTVTTGHQLSLYGGAKYFIHKIFSIIKLAETLNKSYPNYKVLPIFWLASEDHDFEEVNNFKTQNVKIASKNTAEGPLGRLHPKVFVDTFEQFKSAVGTSLSAKYLKEIFEKSFEMTNWSEATRYWVQCFFGEQIIIIDGDDAQLKKMSLPLFERELFEQNTHQNIENTNQELSKLGYHIQVHSRNINLFYIENGLRERIVKTPRGFSILNTNIEFTEDEMRNLLKTNIESISPNAIFRPLYEEFVLPNLAYIGGPGELAYWLQLKSNFEDYKVTFPILVLRDSFVFVSPKHLETLDKYQLSFSDLGLNEDELIQLFLNKNAVPEVDFKEDNEKLNQYFKGLEQKTNQLLKNHQKMMSAELKRMEKFIKKLDKKVFQDLKLREEAGIHKIVTLQKTYFPNGKLNERSQGFIDDFIGIGQEKYLEILLQASDCFSSDLKVIVPILSK